MNLKMIKYFILKMNKFQKAYLDAIQRYNFEKIPENILVKDM